MPSPLISAKARSPQTSPWPRSEEKDRGSEASLPTPTLAWRPSGSDAAGELLPRSLFQAGSLFPLEKSTVNHDTLLPALDAMTSSVYSLLAYF